jgi:purine-nucleoside phosphorylase
VSAAPIHLTPAAELAERVLLPGDPHRALAVAQALLERPRMFNHQRGLWGYTGRAHDGELLTVQSTGMGGPSAAIVAEELIGLGARTLVRIGTCGALSPDLRIGELVVAQEVIPADGASRALGAGERLLPDPALTEALAGVAGARAGTIVSTDLFYDGRPEASKPWVDAGALAVEMEAAALLQVASLRGVAGACILLVTDLVGPPRTRMPAAELEAAGVRLGEAAYEGLTTRPR